MTVLHILNHYRFCIHAHAHIPEWIVSLACLLYSFYSIGLGQILHGSTSRCFFAITWPRRDRHFVLDVVGDSAMQGSNVWFSSHILIKWMACLLKQ